MFDNLARLKKYLKESREEPKLHEIKNLNRQSPPETFPSKVLEFEKSD